MRDATRTRSGTAKASEFPQNDPLTRSVSFRQSAIWWTTSFFFLDELSESANHNGAPKTENVSAFGHFIIIKIGWDLRLACTKEEKRPRHLPTAPPRAQDLSCDRASRRLVRQGFRWSDSPTVDTASGIGESESLPRHVFFCTSHRQRSLQPLVCRKTTRSALTPTYHHPYAGTVEGLPSVPGAQSCAVLAARVLRDSTWEPVSASQTHTCVHGGEQVCCSTATVAAQIVCIMVCVGMRTSRYDMPSVATGYFYETQAYLVRRHWTSSISMENHGYPSLEIIGPTCAGRAASVYTAEGKIYNIVDIGNRRSGLHVARNEIASSALVNIRARERREEEREPSKYAVRDAGGYRRPVSNATGLMCPKSCLCDAKWHSVCGTASGGFRGKTVVVRNIVAKKRCGVESPRSIIPGSLDDIMTEAANYKPSGLQAPTVCSELTRPIATLLFSVIYSICRYCTSDV